MQYNPKGWIAEYYPVMAPEVKREDALAHSAKKWEGLRKVNLERYGLSTPPVTISSSTCALCFYWQTYEDRELCKGCPLPAELGRNCDYTAIVGEPISPFKAWRQYSDPEPMIDLIGRCLSKQV